MSTDHTNEIAATLAKLAALIAEQRSDNAEVSEPQTQASFERVLISVPEAAQLLGISRASAYRYAADGNLPVKRFGRRVYVIRDRLADLIVPDSTSHREADAA